MIFCLYAFSVIVSLVGFMALCISYDFLPEDMTRKEWAITVGLNFVWPILWLAILCLYLFFEISFWISYFKHEKV